MTLLELEEERVREEDDLPVEDEVLEREEELELTFLEEEVREEPLLIYLLLLPEM